MCNRSNASNGKKHRVTTWADITTNELRTIEPLKPAEPCALPIMAVSPDRTVTDEQGNVLSFAEYVEQLPDLPRHLVVTFSSDRWLWELHERWKEDPRWTWAVMVQQKPRTKLRQHVTYYGFRHKHKRAFANPVLDASSFTKDYDAASLVHLGQWVREFCNTYGLKVRSSSAGIASQLLRHPMFYPEARRMVPRFVNDTARTHLPGPYYESYVDTTQRIEAAYYIDQEAAYHYAAQTTPLPNSNSIRAAGHTHGTGVYARAGGELYEREMRKHGLVQAEVIVPPPSHRDKFLPRVMRTPGRQLAWLWTNEIPLLESLGLRIVHLVSVWGTEEVDKRIVDYANWARDMSKRHPHLKALLLMPYGALGKRPDKLTIHRPGGDEDLLLAGQWIEGTSAQEVSVQTYTANALQLGLIQAHVRALSLDMARKLSERGDRVISVYADGIFVRLEGNTAPMFAPWRLKEENLEVHLAASLRVPVRARVQREYMAATIAAATITER